jgi:hypothetical protein
MITSHLNLSFKIDVLAINVLAEMYLSMDALLFYKTIYISTQFRARRGTIF